VRQRDYPDAVAELRRASELAPDDARYVYTYAIALNSTGGGPEALAVLQRAQQRFPANEEILSALVSISRDRGDMPAALKYAVGLLRLHPNDVRLAMLVRDLEQHQPK
jgi:Flp pilus assembly protein TadD